MQKFYRKDYLKKVLKFFWWYRYAFNASRFKIIKVTGKDAQASLGRSNITCNKNGIPFDTESPFITSGIRLGTPACTTRGFKAEEFKLIADLIYKVVKGLSENKTDNSKMKTRLKKRLLTFVPLFLYMEIK